MLIYCHPGWSTPHQSWWVGKTGPQKSERANCQTVRRPPPLLATFFFFCSFSPFLADWNRKKRRSDPWTFFWWAWGKSINTFHTAQVWDEKLGIKSRVTIAWRQVKNRRWWDGLLIWSRWKNNNVLVGQRDRPDPLALLCEHSRTAEEPATTGVSRSWLVPWSLIFDLWSLPDFSPFSLLFPSLLSAPFPPAGFALPPPQELSGEWIFEQN